MPFDVFQQVFSLSVLSTLVNGLKANQSTLQANLQSRLTEVLPTIGGWQLVWGPVVLKDEPENTETQPDNSWYIAFHPHLQFEDGSEHPTYVIAIANTPQQSLHVWMKANFAVNVVTDFKAWVAGGIENPPTVAIRGNIQADRAYIATGTVNTAHLLLTTPGIVAPSKATNAESVTLLDFITNLDKSVSPRFIATGHGLGGVLSPSLALALVLAGHIPVDHTLTYPVAGPSPGNTTFADLFVQTFPARKSPGAASYQGWNLNLVNRLDAVPQAWCPVRSISTEQNLLNIPSLYGGPVLHHVQNTAAMGVLWSKSSGVLYKPLPSQYFTRDPPPAAPTNFEEFLDILGPQHWNAYISEVGVEHPPSPDVVQLDQPLPSHR